MPDIPLVVSVEDLARRLRLQQPLEEDDRWILQQAVVDAQADVEAYLGRPVTPRTFTERGLLPHHDGWRLREDPLIAVVSAVEETTPGGEPTGRYTVTYTAGLDAANDPLLSPIRRYVAAHAMHSGEAQRLLERLDPQAARRVRSVSVEGQSVSFEGSFQQGRPGTGEAGALPSLSTVERWKRRSVFQRRTRRPRPGSGLSGWW